MYTKLDDWSLAHKVNELLQAQPSITKKELCKLLITNWHRLNYLEQQGLIRRNANDAKTDTLICE
jgi:hypothetical protein